MDNHTKAKLGDSAKKVLIVEDNPLVQKIICHTFKECGFEVDVTDMGHEAVSLIKRHHYDFILLDFGLPDLSGYEVARLIRKYESKYLYPPCPIAICSASMDSAQEKNCFAAGANWVFQKPLCSEMMVQIEDLLKRV
ncbi:MAG: response regulator [Legionellales bacterium]|jgi:CheY-like chemotaxis protein